MFPLSLEWSRCPDGIETVDRGEREDVNGFGEKISGRPKKWLRGRTDRRAPVLLESIDLESPLALQYVNTRTPEARIGFMERYGFLVEGIIADDGAEEWPADWVEDQHESLCHALTKSFGKSVAEKSTDLNALLQSAHLKTSVEFAGDGKGRMVFHPQSLLHLMCLEVTTAAINEVDLARCANCNDAFFTGRMAHRRIDAKFCSDRCRVAAMRKRNAAKAG